jgi:hypothetical protein
LARAYAETGDLTKAKSISKKVLDLDPFNSIAKKCLQKWSLARKLGNDGTAHFHKRTPRTFLEEPGKTKITQLLNLGSAKTLAALDTGDHFILNAHKHKVTVATLSGEYVGKLADDVSARLRNLIKQGYTYEVMAKSIDPNNVKVFIRETTRPPSKEDLPSFTGEKIDYVSFTPPQMIHKSSPIVPHED